MNPRKKTMIEKDRDDLAWSILKQYGNMSAHRNRQMLNRLSRTALGFGEHPVFQTVKGGKLQ